MTALSALDSEIPAEYPEKEAVESAIQQAFEVAEGAWRAGVLVVKDAPWWVLFVQEMGRGFRRSALLDSPLKQRPESVAHIVKDLMQERRRAPRPPTRSRT